MKKFFLFLLIWTLNQSGMFAQAGSFFAVPSWPQIDSLIQRDMRPESAFKAVQSRWTWAKQKKDKAEELRCQLYVWALQEWQSTKGQEDVIQGMEDRLKKELNPLYQSMLQLMLAQQLTNVVEQHRWEIQSRSQHALGVKGPRKNWSLKDYRDSIGTALAQAEKWGSTLAHTSLGAIPFFCQPGTPALPHSTVQDLRVKAQLDFWDMNWTGVPGWKNDSALVRKTYADWQKMHVQDADPQFLLWIKTAAMLWEKNQGMSREKWQTALESLVKIHAGLTGLGKVYYALAEAAMQSAASYHPRRDTLYRWGYKKALQWIEKAQKELDPVAFESFGLARLADEVHRPSLMVQTENRQEPHKPFRIFVHYRNLTGIRYYLVPSALPIEKRWTNGAKPSWPAWPPGATVVNIDFPTSGDHQNHGVEIKVEGLAPGAYTLWAKGNLPTGDTLVPKAMAQFQVSRLGIIRDENKVFVRDVFTGHPLPTVAWQLLDVDKQNRSSPTDKPAQPGGKILASGVSNDKGQIDLPLFSTEGHAWQIQLQKDKDQWMESVQVFRPLAQASSPAQVDSVCFVYTDRSLYRMGQTISFTGLGLAKDQKGKTIFLPGWLVKAELLNGENKCVDSVWLHTQTNGSFSGHLRVPESSKGGYYRLHIKGQKSPAAYLRVEAYKKPDFLVQWDLPPAAQQLTDSLQVNGTVMAYAGYPLGGAEAVFKVKAMGWEMVQEWRKMPFPIDFPEETIVVKTDAQGRIRLAMPPLALPENQDPNRLQILYQVQVKISLPNGATLEKQLLRVAQNKQYSLAILPAQSQPDERGKFSWPSFPQLNTGEFFLHQLPNLDILVSDANKQRIQVPVMLSVVYQGVPKQFYRQPLWRDQDQFLYSRAAYQNWFPHDPYDPQDLLLPPDSLVKQQELTIDQQGALDLGPWVKYPGTYTIRFDVKEPNGHLTTQTMLWRVIDQQAPADGFQPELVLKEWPAKNKTGKEWVHGFAVAEIPVLQKLSSGNQMQYSETQTANLKNLIPSPLGMGFPVTYQLATWYAGRFYNGHLTVQLPPSQVWQVQAQLNKKVFQPGEKASWQWTVTNSDKKALPALVWGTIYDARLESLQAHQWLGWNDRQWVPFPSFLRAGHWGEGFAQHWNLPQKTYREKAWGLPELLYDGSQYWQGLALQMAQMRKSGPLNEVVMTGTAGGASPKNFDVRIRGKNSLPQQEEDYDKVYSAPAITDPLTGQNKVNGRKAPSPEGEAVTWRKDFRETAFFLPAAATDSLGQLTVDFTFPDELTQWKWMGMAMTKDGHTQLLSGTVQTQKKLMWQPNWPRFLREGDQWEWQVLLANADSLERTGTAVLELLDPDTQRPVDGWFQNSFPQQYFTVAAGESTLLRFPIQIPFGYNKPLLVRLQAQAGNVSDAVEVKLPVLSRRELVREAIPLVYALNTQTSFGFPGWNESLSPSLTQEKFEVHLSLDPMTSLIQTLDSLPPASPNNSMDLVQNLRQLWLRLSWQQPGLDTQTKDSLYQVSLAKIKVLSQLQLPNGLFPWWAKGPGDSWMTQEILLSLGLWRNHLPKALAQSLDSLGAKALQGLRQQSTTIGLGRNLVETYIFQLWGQVPSFAQKSAWQKAQQKWQSLSLQDQVWLCLSAPDAASKSWAQKILLSSFKERAQKDSTGEWTWKENPAVAATMIHCFVQDSDVVKGIYYQALRQVQSMDKSHDPRFLSLLEAMCFSAPLSHVAAPTLPLVSVGLGKAQFTNELKGQNKLGPTVKATIERDKITPQTGQVSIQSKGGSSKNGWGARLYGSATWWYREDVSALPPAGKALQVRKKYFRAFTQKGQTQWEEIKPESTLPLGEKLRIELEIFSQEALSHVVCTDDRFSGAEPIEQMSGAVWEPRLTAYRHLTDSTMEFYLPILRKGLTRLTYDIFLTQSGIFHSGISRLYSAFSPGFTAREAGTVIRVKPTD